MPFVEQVAGPLDAEVVLLRVIEPPSPVELVASAGVVAPDTFTVRDVEAKAYLSELQRQLSKKNVTKAQKKKLQRQLKRLQKSASKAAQNQIKAAEKAAKEALQKAGE